MTDNAENDNKQPRAGTHDAVQAMTVVLMSLLPELYLKGALDGDEFLKLVDEIREEMTGSTLNPAAAGLILKLVSPLRATVKKKKEKELQQAQSDTAGQE